MRLNDGRSTAWFALAAFLSACGQPAGVADSGTNPDAGIAADAGTADGGAPDAGVPDAGVPDGGPQLTGQFTTLMQGAALPAPDQVIPPGNGLPASFIDAQHDAAGNLWAVSRSNLFYRAAGATQWTSFDASQGLSDQPMLSVGGGAAGTAWVGYDGLGFGDATDPPSWRYTGGADKVVLTATGIEVTHYALVSPPGTYPQYPDGRFKLRHTYRVYPTKTGPFAGDAWFGCNHGGAQVNAAGEVLEHQHPLDCIWDPVANDCLTTHEGNVPAIGFYANGDVLFGGSYGIMSLDYNDGVVGGDFWGKQPIHNMTLFANPIDPDAYGSEDIVGIGAASDGTVWAAAEHSGLAHLQADGKTVDIFQEADGLPSNDIADMAIDSHDTMWMATPAHGLYRLDLHTGVWQEATGLPSSATQRIMFETTDGPAYITLVTASGIVIYVIPTTP